VKERQRKSERVKTGLAFQRKSEKVKWRTFALSLFRSFTLSLLLLACGTDPRQKARIPPLPTATDSSRTEAALQALTRAINQSSPPSAYAKRARLYLSSGRLKEALNDIDEAISRNNTEGTYFLIRAQVLRALRQPQKALENAQRAEILGADTPELYTLLADVWQQQNQFPRARLYLAKALQMAPYEGEAYFFNGLITAKQGDTTGAIALYQQSLKLKPRYLETYNQLASIYRSLGNFGQALTYNEQAIRYFPNEARLTYGRGLIYHASGRLDSALTFYRETVRLEPNYYQANFQAGLILQRWRAYAQALTNYSRVQQLNPQFPRIHTYIGYCQEQLGMYEEAVASYTQSAKLNPGDGQAVAGMWRAQRRMYAPNPYNSVNLPPENGTATQGATAPVVDNRIDIPTIQPRTRLSTQRDSTK
jgi:tetratricopeptide (TPR) repeat protein